MSGNSKIISQQLGHARPQMKILENGAGTGGLTAKFLEHLKSEYVERLYSKYTFSDISSDFFCSSTRTIQSIRRRSTPCSKFLD